MVAFKAVFFLCLAGSRKRRTPMCGGRSISIEYYFNEAGLESTSPNHPCRGSTSRILIFFHPGSRGQRGTGSRIRDTGKNAFVSLPCSPICAGIFKQSMGAAWRKLFLGIYSWAPYWFKNSGSDDNIPTSQNLRY